MLIDVELAGFLMEWTRNFSRSHSSSCSGMVFHNHQRDDHWKKLNAIQYSYGPDPGNWFGIDDYDVISTADVNIALI